MIKFLESYLVTIENVEMIRNTVQEKEDNLVQS
jgi:hypothetical protein